jgi:hypothetical protein
MSKINLKGLSVFALAGLVAFAATYTATANSLIQLPGAQADDGVTYVYRMQISDAMEVAEAGR